MHYPQITRRIGVVAGLLLIFVVAVGHQFHVFSAAPPQNVHIAKAAGALSANNVSDCLQKQDSADRAWCLLDELVSGDGHPAWENWYPVPPKGMQHFCELSKALDVDPSHGFHRGARLLWSLDQPRKLLSSKKDPNDRKQFTWAERNAAPRIAGVLFNSTARDYVCGSTLQPDLDAALERAATVHGSSAQGGEPSIGFPAGSIAVKTVWALVPQPDPALNVEARVPVWDRKLYSSVLTPGSPDAWKTFAHFNNFDPQAACQFKPPDVSAGWPRNAPPISLGCFYAVPISRDDRRSVEKQLGANLSAEPISADQYWLVLLGFHIAAKVNGYWTWQTYWWSDRAFDCSDRDSTILERNPIRKRDPNRGFANYIMSSGSPDPNPYLEAQLPNGMDSECKSCHDVARFYPGKPKNSSDMAPDDCFTANQQIALSAPPKPGCLDSFAYTVTDSMWTLADSNVTLQRHEGPPPATGLH